MIINQWRGKMKYYDESKSEMEAIQQHIIDVKKNERANTLKGIKLFSKEFDFAAVIPKGSLAKRRNQQ